MAGRSAPDEAGVAARVPAAPLKVGVVALVPPLLAGTVRVTAGPVVSIPNVLAAVPMLPAPSVWDACAVYVPSIRATVGVTVQEPPVAVVVRVCTGFPVTVEPA